jgi:hypothetical protein
MPMLQLPKIRFRVRLACASGAVLTAATILAAVLGAFLGASPAQWVVPTDELLEMLARCREIHARSAREVCLNQAVLAHAERQSQTVSLAPDSPASSP